MEGSDSGGAAGSPSAMWVILAAMTLPNSMILVDQTAVAIVSGVFPRERRGTALGVLPPPPPSATGIAHVG